MPFPLNNKTTADDYTEANTLQDQPPCVMLQLHVFNAAIYYQVQIRDLQQARGQPWRNEVFLAPGFHTFMRAITGIRFRSGQAGVPAQVTAVLIPADELPLL